MEVIDANNLIFGRAATHIAKKLLQGEEVKVINAEKFVLVGEPKNIVEKYSKRRAVKHKRNPELSPKWPRVPYLLVKRMIRGMLPYRFPRGKAAFKRLRVYEGNPENLEATTKLKNAEFDNLSKHITIEELCVRLGYVR